MEKNQQMTSSSNGLIKNSDNSAVLVVLAKVFVLLGVPPSKIPKDDSKAVLLDFVKNRINCTLEDFYMAFVFAVEGKTGVDLTLYGEMFSPKLVFDVVQSYKNYIAKNNKAPKEEQMINHDKFIGIINLMNKNEESKKILNSIVEKKEEPKKEIKRLPHYDFHQKCMRSFDLLRKNYGDSSGRYIKRFGKMINLEQFITIKAEQLIRVTALLEERNTDLL